MRAAVLAAYGAPEGLQLQEIDKPEPKAGELLVCVHATSVTRGDTEIRAFDLPWLFRIPLRIWLGLFGPKPNTIMGMEFAGIVESVGAGVDRFEPGDAVFGPTGMGFGAYAEYVCVSADEVIAKKPECVSFEQAAAVGIGGLAALGYLNKGRVHDAKKVLIRGASGSIGTFAVQLAKHFGAHVTGVCPTDSVQRVEQLGADVVIDYTRQDFTENGETYDLILDVVGKMSISRCLRSLSRSGCYVRGTVPGLWEVLRTLWATMTSRKRVVIGDAGESTEGLVFLAGLLETGELETVVDRRYPLEQIAQAHRYVEKGHKKGNVIITMVPGELDGETPVHGLGARIEPITTAQTP